MPHSATDRVSRGLRWAGSLLLLGGAALIVVGIGFTRSADALITAAVVAALAFGVPSAAAFGFALWLEYEADRIKRRTAGELRVRHHAGNPFREPLRRYAVAVAAVALAWGCRILLDQIALGQVPFLTFLLAVIAAGWFGGFGPAALATLLSLLVTWFFYLKGTIYGPSPDLGRFVVLGLFVIVGLGIAAITAALHAALERTQQLSLEVARLRERLGEAPEAPSAPPLLPPP